MAEGTPIRYGMQIKLRHQSTDKLLKSLDRAYCHPNTSGQQMVVATIEYDESTVWRVLGGSTLGDSFPVGEEVKRGDVLRLEHVVTRKHLHSHGDRRAPLNTDQQEVTGWGGLDTTNTDDDWVLDPQTGNVWMMDEPVRLTHRATDKNLHSHDRSHPVYTAGFQEVTGFGGRDAQDFWVCLTGDQLPAEKRFTIKELGQGRWITWLNIIGSVASITGWTLVSLKQTLSSLTLVSFLSLTFASTLTLGVLLVFTAGCATLYRAKTFNPRSRLWTLGFWLIAFTVYALVFLASWKLWVLAADYVFPPIIRWALGIDS